MQAYATVAQLNEWLPGDDLPDEDEALRLLARASEVVEGYVLAGYATRQDGSIVDPDIAAWLADAACAQVEFWGVVSEEHGIAGVFTGSTSAGGVTHNMPRKAGPRVLDILDRAGLRVPGRRALPYRRPLDRIGRSYL